MSVYHEAGQNNALPRKFSHYNRICEPLRQQKKGGYTAEGQKLPPLRDGSLRIHAAVYALCKGKSSVIAEDVFLQDRADLPDAVYFKRCLQACFAREALLAHIDHLGRRHLIYVDPEFPEFANAEKHRLEALDAEAKARKEAAKAKRRAKRASFLDAKKGNLSDEKPFYFLTSKTMLCNTTHNIVLKTGECCAWLSMDGRCIPIILAIKKTTTPESEWPCDVEESRACVDTEREEVVFSFDNFDEENAWSEWDGEYADADAPELSEAVEDVCDELVNIALLLDITSKPGNSSKAEKASAGSCDDDHQQAPPAPAVVSVAPPEPTVVTPGPVVPNDDDPDDDDDPFADADFAALRAAAARQAQAAAAARKSDPFADDDVLQEDVPPVPPVVTVSGPVTAARPTPAAGRKVIAALADEFGLPSREVETTLARITKGASQRTLDTMLDQAQKGYDTAKAKAKKENNKIETPWNYYQKILRRKVEAALVLASENGGKPPVGSSTKYVMSEEQRKTRFYQPDDREAEFKARPEHKEWLDKAIRKNCPNHSGGFETLSMAKRGWINKDAFRMWLAAANTA